MPVLGQEILKRIELVNPEAWIEIVVNPSAAVWQNLPDGIDSQYVLLSRIIKKWNFTNPDATDADINPENIKQALSVFDLKRVLDTLGLSDLISDVKKNS